MYGWEVIPPNIPSILDYHIVFGQSVTICKAHLIKYHGEKFAVNHSFLLRVLQLHNHS